MLCNSVKEFLVALYRCIRLVFVVMADFPVRLVFVVMADFPVRLVFVAMTDFPVRLVFVAMADFPVRLVFVAMADFPVRLVFVAMADFPVRLAFAACFHQFRRPSTEGLFFFEILVIPHLYVLSIGEIHSFFLGRISEDTFR